jgi:hypothetical protein
MRRRERNKHLTETIIHPTAKHIRLIESNKQKKVPGQKKEKPGQKKEKPQARKKKNHKAL